MCVNSQFCTSSKNRIRTLFEKQDTNTCRCEMEGLGIVLCDAGMVFHENTPVTNQMFHHGYDGAVCDGEAHAENTDL